MLAFVAILMYNGKQEVIDMIQSSPARKKSTFLLSEDLVAEIKALVSIKGLRSQNALVEEALRTYIEKARRELLQKQYLEASRDPLYLSDIEEVEKAFRGADNETARMIP